MPFDKDFLKSAIKNLYDELNRFLTIILFILFIITIFIKNFILDISKFLVLGLIIFRLFSKNKVQRNKENKLYLKILNIICKPFSNFKRSFQDRKKFIYRKCHKCKTILKLPLPEKIKINHAKCPNCGKLIVVFTFNKKRSQHIKVEVIKKERKGE